MSETVFQHSQRFLSDSCVDSEQRESGVSAQMVLYLTDSHRVQKVLWRQLFILDSMMSLLGELTSAEQLMTQTYPPLPGDGAPSSWKSLKVQFGCALEETETLLRTLQNKVQQIQDRRHQLSQLLLSLDNKNALQSCDGHLSRLRAESEAVLEELTCWRGIRDRMQTLVSAHQSSMQLTLLSVSQWELSVELKPRLLSNLWANDLEPLQLTVSWSPEDYFRLQVKEASAVLLQDHLRVRRSELSAVLLEVLQSYMGQAQLLSEVQKLRSSFAIDWRPSQRLLVYLKSSALVCHLLVEEGYPLSGGVRLLSVCRDGHTVDTSGLKCDGVSSLAGWLCLLQTSALI